MCGFYILLYGSQKIAKQPVLRLGSTGCCYVLFNPFSINSGSLFIQLHQIQQDLDALIHLFGSDALTRPWKLKPPVPRFGQGKPI